MAYAHSRNSVWINRSALPLVRGVYARVRSMTDVQLLAHRAEGARHVTAAVVCEHSADADPARAEPGDGAREKGRTGRPELVAEDFDVGDAAVILQPSYRTRRTSRRRDDGVLFA